MYHLFKKSCLLFGISDTMQAIASQNKSLKGEFNE